MKSSELKFIKNSRAYSAIPFILLLMLLGCGEDDPIDPIPEPTVKFEADR